MRRIAWTASAQRDLRNIVLFYREIAPDLPDRLVGDVERATLILLDYPQLGPAVNEAGLRRCRAAGTPFLLFYRVSSTTVRILKVRDARSNWNAP